MSIKSGLFAAITTIVVMLVLGNGWVARRAGDGGDFAALTRQSIAGRLRWQVWDAPSGVQGATIAYLLSFIVVTAVLGAIVGRARPLAAFVGGWGAFLAASVVSSGVYGLVVDDRFAPRPGDDVIDTFSFNASPGAVVGMWLGWLVGLAVMLGSLGADRRSRPAPPAGGWGGGPAYDPGHDPQAPEPSPFGPATAPPPPPPAPSTGGPVIGTPPDRTQVFGEPPPR
ncbi:hypothetical protein HC251_03715 [Iamia sp. SCSIO 61187]|uniref:hypothetical protein n=1 Tax=Iamia sp. SCSIO 61187 TaxID=2722752 RepID=UPI001C62EB4E|nr:hypothetical protein [Iamia sp. SCSIO 61187]QYG91632.1 hypothetical protein HC251_03715 [Iamia sp. SCSIO 61187]